MTAVQEMIEKARADYQKSNQYKIDQENIK